MYPNDIDYLKVSVVMGTRDEEKAIEKVIKDIKNVTGNQVEIIIVDGSKDRTPEIAEGLGAKVIRQEPKGYGIAVKLALLSATRDIIITTEEKKMLDESLEHEKEGKLVSLEAIKNVRNKI
mgnify:CR=1 FL=1